MIQRGVTAVAQADSFRKSVGGGGDLVGFFMFLFDAKEKTRHVFLPPPRMVF